MPFLKKQTETDGGEFSNETDSATDRTCAECIGYLYTTTKQLHPQQLHTTTIVHIVCLANKQTLKEYPPGYVSPRNNTRHNNGQGAGWGVTPSRHIGFPMVRYKALNVLPCCWWGGVFCMVPCFRLSYGLSFFLLEYWKPSFLGFLLSSLLASRCSAMS